MQIINMTPHDINFVRGNIEFDSVSRHWIAKLYEIYRTIPSSGSLRVGSYEEFVKELDNIPVYRPKFGDCPELPEEKEDTTYIVSLKVAQAYPHRKDLYIPGRIVYDQNNHIIGCMTLSVI